eukprot:09733.XXX_325412_325561_1 [CDS] Oithona nana genome sequencing.
MFLESQVMQLTPSAHLRILKLGPSSIQFQKSRSMITPVMSPVMTPKDVA